MSGSLRPLKIGMLAPLEMRVPPIGYGGTELIVSLLTEELVRRGHQVTLFASGDSVTSAELVSVCPTHLRDTDHEKGVLNMLNALACIEQADRFDIIHNHTLFEGLSLAGLVKTPVLTTLHGGLKGDWLRLFEHYPGWYNTISRSESSLLPLEGWFAGVVYNAIDCDSYPFDSGPREDYMLFLSRISHEKGPHLAIEVARRLGRRLIIAGNVDTPDREYFESKILPAVDGDLIQYVGEADYATKRRLMARAHCLLAPITWNEPFGLFLVEAQVCGTPVVVFNRGAAPEVVRHGITGFVVDTMEEMTDAVGRVHMIDPAACRSWVATRFNVQVMADGYLRAYRKLLALTAEERMTEQQNLLPPTANMAASG